MSGDDLSDEVYGDTDPNNLPDDGGDDDPGAVQAASPFPVESGPTSAGDGQPGFPVDGYPGVRAGVFGSGNGLLGLIKVSNPASAGGDASMPSTYMPDGHGGVQLKPGFAATRPKGPFDWGGMSKEIDWPGVALDLGSIAAGALPLAGGTAMDVLKAMPGMGIDTWRELHHDTQPRKGGNAT